MSHPPIMDPLAHVRAARSCAVVGLPVSILAVADNRALSATAPDVSKTTIRDKVSQEELGGNVAYTAESRAAHCLVVRSAIARRATRDFVERSSSGAGGRIAA